MNRSERTNEFSKGRSSFLTVKSRVFSWIKLLFIPSVAKRSSASELSNEIIKYLEQNNFKINTEFSDDSRLIYNYIFLDDYIFQATLSIRDKYEIVCYFDVFLNGKKSIIADRFVLNTFDDFIFLITKNMRSPLFIVN